jgi:hypothetical protein
MRVSNAASKLGRTFVFNPTTGKWLKDATTESDSLLQFKLPREVTPCQLKNAQITLKIHAPSRTVELSGLRNGTPVVVKTWKSPSGVFNISIDDPELLQLNENGALEIGVNVSQTDAQIASENRSRAKAPTSPSGTAPSGARSNRQNNERSVSTDNLAWQIDYLRLQASGKTQ